jgi:anti-sigma factor RsiW
MSSSNTDFDATLLDWLYGELDSDAMASFEAHLETHPEHKAEAHALRDTRMAFQELPQAEPSGALTAMLMQQAAASVQPKEGIWASIVGFFQPVVLHPAAAAMATVVLLAGVVGTLYLKNGSMVAEPTAVSSKAERPAQAPGAAAPEPAMFGDRESESVDDGAKSGNAKSVNAQLEPTAKADDNNARKFSADLASPAQEEVLRAAISQEDGRLGRQSRKDATDKVQLGAREEGGDGDSFAFNNSTSNAISGGAVAIDSKLQELNEQTPAKKNRSRRGMVGGSTPETVAPPSPKVSKTSTPANKPQSWESQQVADFQVAALGKRCRDAGRIAYELK